MQAAARFPELAEFNARYWRLVYYKNPRPKFMIFDLFEAGPPPSFNDLFKILGCQANIIWVISDQWDTRLAPAQALGMTTVLIRAREKGKIGNADLQYYDWRDFLDDLSDHCTIDIGNFDMHTE